jgi:hypothetical protein
MKKLICFVLFLSNFFFSSSQSSSDLRKEPDPSSTRRPMPLSDGTLHTNIEQTAGGDARATVADHSGRSIRARQTAEGDADFHTGPDAAKTVIDLAETAERKATRSGVVSSSTTLATRGLVASTIAALWYLKTPAGLSGRSADLFNGGRVVVTLGGLAVLYAPQIAVGMVKALVGGTGSTSSYSEEKGTSKKKE